MAGDWIPYSKDLSRKVEVIRIADALKKSRYEVVGLLMEFWSWVDGQTEDGFLPGIDVRILSALHADICPQLVRLLSDVKWLIERPDGVEVPNFDYWMGRSAKRRLRENQRKNLQRSNKPSKKAHAKRTNDRTPSGQMSASDADKMRPTVQYSSRGMNSPTTPSCTETEKPVSVLSFPTDGDPSSWDLTQGMIDEWHIAYPSLDILAEAHKALVWVNANPDRRKTARGMKRFLVSWLGRAQNRKPGNSENQNGRPRTNMGPDSRSRAPAGKYAGFVDNLDMFEASAEHDTAKNPPTENPPPGGEGGSKTQQGDSPGLFV